MLALKSLGQRFREDRVRPQDKFARTPSYSEDVRWLHSEVAQRLGLPYVESFLLYAALNVTSPFVLQVGTLAGLD